LEKSSNYEAPHCAVFSSLISFSTSYAYTSFLTAILKCPQLFMQYLIQQTAHSIINNHFMSLMYILHFSTFLRSSSGSHAKSCTYSYFCNRFSHVESKY